MNFYLRESEGNTNLKRSKFVLEFRRNNLNLIHGVKEIEFIIV